jgi:co-chaperonin GroES (HSP10)
MQAVGLFVIVKKEKAVVRTSKSGLDIPTDMEDRFLKGTIISVSELVMKDFGIKNGDIILFDKHSGNEFKGIDGEIYKVITCRDIAVIL